MKQQQQVTRYLHAIQSRHLSEAGQRSHKLILLELCCKFLIELILCSVYVHHKIIIRGGRVAFAFVRGRD